MIHSRGIIEKGAPWERTASTKQQVHIDGFSSVLLVFLGLILFVLALLDFAWLCKLLGCLLFGSVCFA